MTYLVELVQTNRIIKIKARREDYDEAVSVYDKVKRTVCREARLLVMRGGKRVLLKYVNKSKRPTVK